MLHQERVTIINMNVPNNRPLKHMKKKKTKLKRKMDKLINTESLRFFTK